MTDEGPVSDGEVSFDAGRLPSILFADRIGLVLFLATIVFYVATLRVELIINDNYTIANTLVAVADGNLHIDPSVYGEGPGLHTVDGAHYGRNYGHVFLSVPWLWALEIAGYVADLRLLIVGGWSLAVLLFADQAGVILGRREQFRIVGAVVALALYFANVAVAYPLEQRSLAILALQLTTTMAAAGTVVLVYRLVADMYDRRQGFVAGLFVGFASPVGYWAAFPKRHALTAFVTLLVVCCFYWSRSASDVRQALRLRTLSYVWVALFAWVSAPEGFMLLVALGSVDVVTARDNSLRTVVILATGLCLALLPFLVTNAVIAGDPLQPPRMLPDYVSETTVTSVADGSGAPAAQEGGETQSGAILLVSSILRRFLAHVVDSLLSMMDPERLLVVFVRSGYLPEIARWDGGLPIRLSFLEAMPLAGALLAGPLAAYRHVRPTLVLTENTKRRVETDALVLAIASLFVVVYWPRLPIHASVTVRYLHPLYPLVGYLLFRLPAVRSVVAEQPRVLAWSYVMFVLVGGQLLVVVLATIPSTLAEAYQIHALTAFVAGILVAAGVVSMTSRNGRGRFEGVLISLAASTSTTYLLLAAFLYFDSLDYALPVSRAVAHALDFI
jgi:hypothetical protein